MLRRSLLRRVTIHSPRGIPFTLSKEEAMEKIKGRYTRGVFRDFFSTNSNHINFNKVTPEYIPFFLCSGTVSCTYCASYKYDRVYHANGKKHTIRDLCITTPINFQTSFEDKNAQIHAGYKYNDKHIRSALAGPDMANNLVRVKNMDMSEGKINMFEMSTTTMRSILAEQLKDRIFKEATEDVIKTSTVKAEEIDILLDQLFVKIAHATPVYVPCYVIDATYDSHQFTMFVNGFNGETGGPYILSPTTFGRISALTAFGASFVAMSPDMLAGVGAGTIMALVMYYVGFYAAKKYPAFWQKLSMEMQELRGNVSQEDDAGGYKPQPGSERTDDRTFHDKRRAANQSWWNWNDADESREYTEAQKKVQRNKARTERSTKDIKGFYALLRVDPNASITEIQSAYRSAALSNHPDQGGSPEKMQEINEAYRVVRDVKRRTEYDLLTE